MFSIEINTCDPKIVDAAVDGLEAGTQVFLTWVPGANPMDMVEPALRLRRAGLFPVPHIGARHLESRSQLERLATRLTNEAGVERVLIIGGDRDQSTGPYDSSIAILRSGVFQKAGIRCFGIAGFPEGNPNISDAVLDEALKEKIEFARRDSLDLFIVTQFCFKPDPIVEWLKRLRGRGINVPVRVGLAGPAGLITLTRYALRCGIGNSLHVLTEHPAFAKLLIEKGPELIIRGIAETAGRADGAVPLGIAGLHFFVFGGFNKTLNWINAHRKQ